MHAVESTTAVSHDRFSSSLHAIIACLTRFVTGRHASTVAGIRTALVDVYRSLRHVPDRIAHAHRRARATALVSSRPLPQQILYVCLGNVCRSPYAEAVSRRDSTLWFAPLPVWRSAGFVGPDRAAPLFAIEVAAERGAPLDRHRSQLVSSQLIDDSDLIVVMDALQAQEVALRFLRRRGVVILGDFDPKPITTRTIADPWNKTREEFVASYDRIDRCLAALVAALGSRVSP